MMNDNNFPPASRGDDMARLKSFLAILLSAILVLVSLSTVFYAKKTAAREELRQNNEMLLLENQTAAWKNALKAIVADLRLLSSRQEMPAFLDKETKESLAALSAALLAFPGRGHYESLLFVDRQGMEIVRVNYHDGAARLVPEDELRRAEDRDFLENVLRLQAGEFHMSPFALSSGRDGIAYPPLPVITFGMPVLDRSGQTRGVIMLNYLGNRLLQPLKQLAADGRRSIYLLNRQGYWLLGPTAQSEWGFLYPGRADQTFQARFPSAWESVSTTQKGHLADPAGLFTYLTFYPHLSILAPSRAYLNAAGPCGCFSGKNEDYYWKLISFVPEQTAGGPSSHLARNIICADGILLLIAAAAAWLVAGAAVRRSAVRQRR